MSVDKMSSLIFILDVLVYFELIDRSFQHILFTILIDKFSSTVHVSIFHLKGHIRGIF